MDNSINANSRSGYIWIGFGVLILILIVLFVFQPFSKPAEGESLSKEISVSDAHQLYQSGVYMLDVRQPEEYVESHIPGVALIPLDQLESRISEIPAGEPVVVVCRSGNRSAAGRDILLKAGFQEVTSMAGGMGEWQRNGYAVETGP